MITAQFDSYQLSEDMKTHPPYPYLNMTEYAVWFGEVMRSKVIGLRDHLNSSVRPYFHQTISKSFLRGRGQEGLKENANESSSTYGIFSWACYSHDVSHTSAFYSLSVNGATQNDALTIFLKANGVLSSVLDVGDAVGPRVLSWVDSCTGFQCGPGCEYKPHYNNPNSTDSYDDEISAYDWQNPRLFRLYSPYVISLIILAVLLVIFGAVRIIVPIWQGSRFFYSRSLQQQMDQDDDRGDNESSEGLEKGSSSEREDYRHRSKVKSGSDKVEQDVEMSNISSQR
jgi:hypothetical protein